MKIGDFVRRKLSTGGLTGPYMQVMHIVEQDVYCDVVGLDEPNIRYNKKNLSVIKHATLCVSEEILMKMKKGLQATVSHPKTKFWVNAFNKDPKLITFYCLPKCYKYTFVIDTILNRPNDIKIIISNKLDT